MPYKAANFAFMKTSLALLFTFLSLSVFAQKKEIKFQLVQSGYDSISLRGLCVVSDSVIWASGNRGTVVKSTNGGKNWLWYTVPGFAGRDFRDIEAFDSNTAIIMSVGSPAVMLKTKDGGKSWKEVYRNNAPAMFLDALAFKNDKVGVVIGDPINMRFFISRTFDGGETWKDEDGIRLPQAEREEAIFAASGSSLQMIPDDPDYEFAFVTGGTVSRFYKMSGKNDQKSVIYGLPLNQGIASTGAFSLAVWNKDVMSTIGGDYSNDIVAYDNFVSTKKGGASWKSPNTPPHGYRSCVIYIDEKFMLSCGTSGIDISKDGGKSWDYMNKESFNVCAKAKKGTSVYMAGNRGRIARMIY
jgi:photosystem II stability/assembly factor-like uncharacterized protein